MCELPFATSSQNGYELQEQLRQAFDLPNTAVDILVASESVTRESGRHFEQTLQYTLLKEVRQFNPRTRAYEVQLIREPHTLDLGLHATPYALPTAS